MLQPTVVTWILLIFGWITCGPLLYAQLVVLLRPHSQKAKELMKGRKSEVCVLDPLGSDCCEYDHQCSGCAASAIGKEGALV